MRIELLEQRMEELELRIDAIGQILPTLVTKDDLRTAIGASEERMRAHVSDEIGASEERMRAHVSDEIGASEVRMRTDLRTHFDVVAESLRHDIRLVAEAVAELSDRMRKA